MSERPTGTVTFVFTDIEGSTAMLGRLAEGYGDLLFAHHTLLRDVWSAHGGVEVSTEGDAFFVAFDSANRAVAATAAAQSAIAGHRWPRDEQLKVRMGGHTGEPRVRDGDYWGADVHYAARVASAARGGQVLVSAATAALASEAELSSLGRHRLKDFPAPVNCSRWGQGHTHRRKRWIRYAPTCRAHRRRSSVASGSSRRSRAFYSAAPVWSRWWEEVERERLGLRLRSPIACSTNCVTVRSWSSLPS
jgi:class 3 adenylate cyclase